jgi:hypothetical protein
MADEPTRRLILERSATLDRPLSNQEEAKREALPSFEAVPEHPSTRPGVFSEREQPTLASPNSATVPAQGNVEQRLALLADRVCQLETDFDNVHARLEQLTDAVSTELLRGRAARMGRYLLWGAVIAAMATFWMLLRLRTGSP